MNHLFDKIYCISLPESTDRWNRFINEYQLATGTDDVVKIFARPPAPEIIQEKADSVLFDYPARTMIGCTLSHIKAMTDALAHGYDRVLILEDDSFFLPEAASIVSVALKEIPDDWGVLYLGGHPTGPLSKVTNLIAKPTTLFWSSWGYAITRSAMHKVIHECLDSLSWNSYDGILGKQTPNIHRYVMCPPVLSVHSGYSTIINVDSDLAELSRPDWERFSP